MTVSGAYGRDYKSRAAVMVDWNAGKDFIIRSGAHEGRYINIEDARGATISIRYWKDRKVHIVEGDEK